MSGKEVKGRKLKIDFDVVQKAKKGFKVNMKDDGNVRFNKLKKKEITKKFQRKENEKKRFNKGRQF